MSTQIVEAPTSVPGSTQYEHLAYVEAYDAILDKDYAFVAYQEIDSTGAWRVRIKGSGLPGSVFEPTRLKSHARAASAQGRPWFAWGFSIDPSPGDPREVQFRVHVTDGHIAEIEMRVVPRQFDGSAGEECSVRFPWPA